MLGRLAVSLSVQGQGFGAELLFSASERALLVAAQIGGVALAIDAKDEPAAEWYGRFGASAKADPASRNDRSSDQDHRKEPVIKKRQF